MHIVNAVSAHSEHWY